MLSKAHLTSHSRMSGSRKIRDTKGTLHAKIGSIKDRNGMDLTEAEDIKKRWQEYTEELYQTKKKKEDSLVIVYVCYTLRHLKYH